MLRTMSVGLIAGSAAMAGLVWAGRSLFTRRKPQGPAPEAAPGPAPADAPADRADAGWEGEALDDVARRDALHDMREGQALELDIDFDGRAEPAAAEAAQVDDDIADDDLDIEIEEVDFGETVGALELPTAQDEPYDAVDAEDVGTAWLLRATQTTPPVGWNAHDVLEGGGHIIEPSYGASDDLGSERGYGSDQEGAPLADHAGVREDDVAAELPVGTVDRAGNMGLRNNANPPDALDAPPTGQLSPTAEELARRAKS
jgi:hypothetical protein